MESTWGKLLIRRSQVSTGSDSEGCSHEPASSIDQVWIEVESCYKAWQLRTASAYKTERLLSLAILNRSRTTSCITDGQAMVFMVDCSRKIEVFA